MNKYKLSVTAIVPWTDTKKGKITWEFPIKCHADIKVDELDFKLDLMELEVEEIDGEQ